MLGWYLFITYALSHIVATIWLVRRRIAKRIELLNYIRTQLTNSLIDDSLDFPMWVNDASNDVDSKFRNIVARYNHPTYRNQ